MRAATLDRLAGPLVNPVWGTTWGRYPPDSVTSSPVPDPPPGFAAVDCRRLTWTAPTANSAGLYRTAPWPPGTPGAASMLVRCSRATRISLPVERVDGLRRSNTDLEPGVWAVITATFTGLRAGYTSTILPAYLRPVSEGGAEMQPADTLDVAGITLVPGLIPVTPAPGPHIWPDPRLIAPVENPMTILDTPPPLPDPDLAVALAAVWHLWIVVLVVAARARVGGRP